MKNESLEKMRQLKMTGMANAYEGVLSLPVNKQGEAHQIISQLIDAEQTYRSHRRMEMFVRLSKLRYQASLHDIDCSPKRNLSKEKLMALADCSYISRGENILITGATGAGKSYLSCALGHHACVQGYRTLYFNMNRFTEQIGLAKLDGSLIKWLNKIRKARLIILDDFGLQAISHEVKLIILQILEERYEKSGTIISSQLPVKKWYEYFNEPTIADAIMDRIIPKAHRIQLKGNSLRTKSKHIS